jgi:hypothetical protein
MADLASVVPVQYRDSHGEVFFDGFDVVAGYGVDIVDLRIPFWTGPVWVSGGPTPAIGDLMLAFGGIPSDSSGGNAAADQLWSALAGRPETVVPWGLQRQTPGGRVSCTELKGMATCGVTQFQSVQVFASPCPATLATPFDAGTE